MECPACRVPLVMSERSGVEIDYCPQCRGIWLDRGELDKIIERSEGVGAMPPPGGHVRLDDHQHGHHDKHSYGHPGSRKSLWRELFD